MKFAGPLMIALGLVLGVMSGTTAYLVPVDRIDPARDQVVLHAPAGNAANPGEPARPVLEPGPPDAPRVIDEANLKTLRDAGVRRIHVKQFTPRLWREWWLFAIGVALLVGGAVVIRRIRRQELEMAANQANANADTPPAATLLEAALAAARECLAKTSQPGEPATRLRTILEGVDDLHERFFEPFEFGRATLIQQLGMAGYARVMDRFATAERQFNRAWSAAADHVEAEALECLQNGIDLLAEACQRLATEQSHA